MDDIQKKQSKGNLGIILIFTAVSMIRCHVWIAPSPLMAEIMDDMGLSFAQSGQLLFIVTVMMGVSLFFGSLFLDRFGPSLTMMIAMIAIFADGMITFCSNNYGVMLFGRIFSGVGFGFSTGAMAAIVSDRFDYRKQGIVNTYNNAMNAVSLALAYAITIPIAGALGSWKTVFGMWAILSLLCAVWIGIAERKSLRPPLRTSGKSEGLSLAAAAKYKEVWLLAVAFCGGLWLNITITTYLPTFLSEFHKADAEFAGAITGIMPMAGLVGCIVLNMISMMKAAYRKRMLLLPLIAVTICSVGISVLPIGLGLYACICLFGFFYNGWGPIVMTTVMRLKGMNPQKVSAAVAIYIGSGSLVTIAAPSAFDRLQYAFDMQIALLLSTVLLLPSIISMIVLIRNKKLLDYDDMTAG